MIGELSEAVESGFRCGRQRRHATMDELARFGSRRLSDAFWRAYGRGMRANQAELDLPVRPRPALEQVSMDFGEVEDGTENRTG